MNSKSPLEITDYCLEEVSVYKFNTHTTKVIDFIQKIQDKYTKKGYHTIWFDVIMGGYDGAYLEVAGTRTETKQQIEERLEQHHKAIEIRKAKRKKDGQLKKEREKALYEKLKRKFGDG